MGSANSGARSGSARAEATDNCASWRFRSFLKVRVFFALTDLSNKVTSPSENQTMDERRRTELRAMSAVEMFSPTKSPQPELWAR